MQINNILFCTYVKLYNIVLYDNGSYQVTFCKNVA